MDCFVLRPFFGFNALEVDCSNCKNLASLQNNKCVDCINSLKLDFDLLELRKSFSIIYYEKGLSSSLRSDKFCSFQPCIVPLFLNFYLVPLPAANEAYSIQDDGSGGKSIIFKPAEYNLCPEDLHLLSELVFKVQNEDLSIDKLDELVPENKSYLKALIRRYTCGLGIIDELLKIRGVLDVYVNSPGNSCLFFNHASHGQLSSNIFFKSEMINKVSTFLRTSSGRPFDEAFPVLHSDISGFASRVCSITSPLSFNGSGFAIRKHSFNPFTLASLVRDKFLSSQAAGLLWFLLDSEVSMLITGPRGSGKTTLLGSLLFNINKSNRLIIIEDTKELPVDRLKSLGYNVEHLRTNSFENSDSFEFSSETALRTALRLGESVLVIGEVRGTEAKTLFEAMRIGASGNSVLGTIHGSSAFDTFDRIVNDLNVPPTSFKAADIVVSCTYLKKGSVKVRRVAGITEVGKNWFSNPAKEKGFFELASFNPRTGKYSFGNLARSELFKRIAFRAGVSVKKCISDINNRAKIIGLSAKSGGDSNAADKGSVSRLGPVPVKSSGSLNNIISDCLVKLKAFGKGSAVSSRELFRSLGSSLSRSSFNSLLNSLESEGFLKSFNHDGVRYFYVSRRNFKFLKP